MHVHVENHGWLIWLVNQVISEVVSLGTLGWWCWVVAGDKPCHSRLQLLQVRPVGFRNSSGISHIYFPTGFWAIEVEDLLFWTALRLGLTYHL